MKQKILITDSLFIGDHHVKQLEDAGYIVERLDKPEATEAELIEVIKGKTGYILGGVEKVTEPVIEAADELKAIVFTGTAANAFITAHEAATKRGIAIGSAPHLNAHAVAEWGMTMTLNLCRETMLLARGGAESFKIARSLSELKVGVLGMGHIGKQYSGMAKGLGVTDIIYNSRTRHEDAEQEFGAKHVSKSELFEQADVVFVAVPHDAGRDLVGKPELESMKPGSLMVSISDHLVFDLDALYEVVKSGAIRAAFDENVKEERFTSLPLNSWFTPNASCAYVTSQALEEVSQSCIDTLLNLLRTGDDKYLENPEYKEHVVK